MSVLQPGAGDQIDELLLCFVLGRVREEKKRVRGGLCILTPSLLSRRPARGAKFLSVK